MSDTTRNMDKILIVDDEPINLALLSATLGGHYDISTAASGAVALDRAAADPPDLLLLDVVMPDLDGYEVLRRWREDERTRDIPVIFVTGRGAASDQIQGLSAGAVDYITKPFEMPIVLARVETHLELKRKSDLLKQLASVDPLTEIGNRRQLDDCLHREWRAASRRQHELALVMIDIDQFKLFNDTYGHSAGDRCLRRVAQAISSSVRRGEDYLARFGGEEFAVVLPGTNEEGALVVAEKVRSSVEALAIPHSASSVSSQVTVSVGVAVTVPQRGDSIESLIEAADRQLYRAKDGGRNRVHPEPRATPASQALPAS